MVQSAIPGLFQCVLSWTPVPGASGTVQNVLHYLDTASPQHDYTNAEVAALVGAVAVPKFWDDVPSGQAVDLKSKYCGTVAPSSLSARNLNKDQVPVEVGTGAAAAGSGECLPPEVAAVLSLSTNLAGRSYRGRVYLPPPVTSQTDGGTIDAAFRAVAVAAFEDDMLTILDGLAADTDLRLVIWSRTLDVATVVTQVSMNAGWDTQRRRGT